MTYWSSWSTISRGVGILVNSCLRVAAAASFLVEDRLAEVDALAADVDVAGPFDQRADVAIALAAERTVGVLLARCAAAARGMVFAGGHCCSFSRCVADWMTGLRLSAAASLHRLAECVQLVNQLLDRGLARGAIAARQSRESRPGSASAVRLSLTRHPPADAESSVFVNRPLMDRNSSSESLPSSYISRISESI